MFLESGLLRPVPIALEVMEVINGRSYRIVPLGMVWPGSALYYASQDARLHRDLLVGLYERKTVLDGGIRMRNLPQPATTLPPMEDRGWVRSRERVMPAAFWQEDLRVVAQGSAT